MSVRCSHEAPEEVSMTSPIAVQVVLVGKLPLPGRAKTRLSPPLSPEQAAEVATALLTDSIAAVQTAAVARRVIALDAVPGPWLPAGWSVLRQRGNGLAEVFCHVCDDLDDDLPVLILPTDTPLLSAAVVEQAARTLTRPDVDAVIGPATDGGWWVVGTARPDRRAFEGIPMSTPVTGEAQSARLRELAPRVVRLEEFGDVDVIDDLVACRPDLAPDSALRRLLSRLLPTEVPVG
jgi:glycosyltransferase A (GT-A) superfamily protein (DUF2064 family)